MKKETRYFVVSYAAKKEGDQVFGEMRITTTAPYLNRKHLAEYIKEDGLNGIIILNIMRLTKEEYEYYDQND